MTPLNTPPIQQFIYLLTDKFFNRCPTHPNPLISPIANYPLADLHCKYKKYKQKALRKFSFITYTPIAVFFPLYMFFHCRANINLTRQTPSHYSPSE